MTRCYWAACAAQVKIRFSVFGAEKRPPGGGKTRGSGIEKRCSHKWDFLIGFSLARTLARIIFVPRLRPPPPPPLRNPEGVANLKEAICVVRSDSIIGVNHSKKFFLFEFKSVDDVGAGKLREMLTLHTNSHAVHGRFTLKKKTVSVRFGTPGPPRELK